MAEPSRVKVRRHRAHVRGDHSECLPANCPLAGRVERDDVRELRQAVEAEFRDDPMRLALGRQLCELAGGKGPAAVGALRELGQAIEAKRRGELAPVGGAVTIDDEIRALVDELVDLGRAERCECPCHAAGHDREVVA